MIFRLKILIISLISLEGHSVKFFEKPQEIKILIDGISQPVSHKPNLK